MEAIKAHKITAQIAQVFGVHSTQVTDLAKPLISRARAENLKRLERVPNSELLQVPEGVATERRPEATVPADPAGSANAGAGRQLKRHGGEDGEGAEPLHARLRAARENANLSRQGVVNRMKAHGVQITIDAIKKHEEGAAKPRPAARKAYASIYEMLVGVTGREAVSLSAAWAVMTVIALLASMVPAAQAARTDLISVLRSE